MKKKLAILGAGTAGLHLCYALLPSGRFSITLYTHKTPDELRQGRVMSTQVHFPHTREREARYQMPQWPEGPDITSIHVSVGGQKLFVGNLQGTGKSVDQRIYFPRYIEDLMNKGVEVRFERVDDQKAQQLSKEYDLVIDCTGKFGPVYPFETVEELSPLQAPMRKCNVGYFFGITPNNPVGVAIYVLPGLGELFEIPAVTAHGPVTILFIEAVPGGELDVFKNMKSPEAFTETMLEVVKTYFPAVHERINQQEFRLCDDQGYTQIAIKPVVRKPYLLLDGKLILGCGDSVVLNDPITGQGSNTTSYCAEQLALHLLDHAEDTYDEAFGKAYWEKILPYVQKVTEWTNAMMAPLPAHIVEALMDCAADQSAADQFASWFNHPPLAHQAFFAGQVQNTAVKG